MLNPSTNYGAYLGMAPTQISSANIDGTGFMLNERAKYTANTGQNTVSTGNPNLDGSGTGYKVILTAGAAAAGFKGTFVKTITIKAQGNTSRGMIRLFLNASGTLTKVLIAEIEIPAVTQSAKTSAFSAVVPLGFNLNPDDKIAASTQNSETFNLIAEGLDWTY